MKNKEEYQIEYEYVNHSGRLVRCKCCTVYSDYHKADEVLSYELSKLEDAGYSDVQGSVISLV